MASSREVSGVQVRVWYHYIVDLYLRRCIIRITGMSWADIDTVYFIQYTYFFKLHHFFHSKKNIGRLRNREEPPLHITLRKKKRDSFTGSFSAIAMGMWTINGAAPFYGWLSYGASYKNGWQMGYPILGTHHITKISPTCFLGGHWTVVKWMIREQRGLSK